MLSRLLVVLGLASLAVLPALGLSGCSSSKKRDVNYGTDAGLDFPIPDAANFSSQPAGDTNPTDVGPDTGLQVDGGSPDTQAALSAADVAPDTGFEVAPADASAQESDLGVDS